MFYTTFNLYYNNTRENASNILYPNEIQINSVNDLYKAVSYDHVCAKYNNFHRKKENFIQANCIMLDIDNADSDNPADWISPFNVRDAFPDVIFYVVFSRNNMKKKGEKSPRPKFHVYFPDKLFFNREEYEHFKDSVCRYFPVFDHNAKDSARFFFGVENPEIKFFNGNILLSDFMKSISDKEEIYTAHNEEKRTDIIPEGKRHCTLISCAACTVKHWGETDKAYHAFQIESKKCVPLLEEKELDAIWKSACSFYHEKIENSPDYLSPELYEIIARGETLKPNDFTDIGQTNVFVKRFGDKIRFSFATGYLYYNGKVWIENKIKVHRLIQLLTKYQLEESSSLLIKARQEENHAIKNDDFSQVTAKGKIKVAENYRKFVMKYRNTSRITAVLTEAQPMVEVDVKDLDKDGFLLNTPMGIIDLHTGKQNPHNPLDYCTKITAINPNMQGAELFQEFLHTITCNDQSLENYLQLVAGMCLIGKVYCENLIIAYGTGKNGKSTFFNLISNVMGDYAGNISAEVLTKNSRLNKKNEFAELRGKRLVMASELEDGTQLDTATVKQLCSTDTIYAEKKYKDPFSFTPTHTTVLCTNHLPSVDALDNGTWRRLVVVPFQAIINDNTEIKNYADYLFQTSGGAVLSWMITGAQKFTEAEYKILQPETVKQAIKAYRSENNWIHNYLSECCESGNAYSVRAGELYQNYQNYCENTGEYKKSKAAFKKAMVDAGYNHRSDNKGSFYSGVRIKSDNIPFIPVSIVTESDGEIGKFSENEIVF